MTTAPHATLSCAQLCGRRFAALLLMVSLGFVAAGCGDKKKDKTATQTAARVNNQEITVHQINHVLEQQRGLPPAQAASASRQVLGRLVDQELAIQEAQNQKLDRDPRVVRQIEAAKREIIARAYVERIGATATRPSADDINKYYNANPALFSERRIYNLEELTIEAKPEQLDALKANLQSAKDPSAFVEYLKTEGFKFNGRQVVTPAEQLPLDRLGPLSRMKDGQSTFAALPNGAQVLILWSSRLQPMAEEQARAAIEQFLHNDRRHKAIQEDLAALRAAAKIEYVGEFAANAETAADDAAAGTTVKETKSPLLGPSSSSGGGVQLPTGGSAPSSAAVENALKGLK